MDGMDNLLMTYRDMTTRDWLVDAAVALAAFAVARAVDTASFAIWGSRSTSRSAAASWMLTAESECAVMSCTSRAMRTRSSYTRRAASSSRVRSASTARCSTARTYAACVR